MIVFGYLLAFLRLFVFAVFTLGCTGYYLLRSLFVGRQLDWALGMRKFWCKVMFPVLGFKVVKMGDALDKPALYVANHISYIDPAIIIKYATNAVVIGKAEVSKWPVIGMAGDITGVIFVERENPESRRSVRYTMARTFKEGFSILNFPEGTTTAGETTLPFLKGGFSVASELGLPVVPVSLVFDNKYAPFLKDEKFLNNWFQTFRKWTTTTYVEFGEPIYADNPATLTSQSEAWVNQSLARNVKFVK